MSGTIPLTELEPGSEAVICDVDDDGALGRRLLDLGFVPDTPIRMIRRAPLGDPLQFELRGYRVCLRRGEARRIRVRRRA